MAKQTARRMAARHMAQAVKTLAQCPARKWPGRVNLIRAAERSSPDAVWTLDISTNEGAAFNLNDDIHFQLNRISARL